MHVVNPSNWVKLYGDILFSVALQKTNSKELAEDLVQDTFLSAVKALPNYRGETSEKNWLFTILNNKIIDYYRKKGRSQTTEEYLNFTNEIFNDGLFEDNHIKGKTWQANWSTLADAGIDSKDFQKVFAACLNKVPLKMKPIFISKFYDDFTTEELCENYSITTANLWVIIHRVKVILKNCLTQHWFNHS